MNSVDPIRNRFLRWASGLRWPTLFVVTAGLFVLDVIIPDFVPLADEILLALLTLLFGAWRKRKQASPPRSGRG